MTCLSNRMLLTSQVVLGLVALAGLSLYPPTQGRILLLPLLDRQSDAAARVALSAHAALLGRGPLPGSWVVVGDRARIAASLHGWDMVMLAAPPAGCADDTRRVTA